MLTEVCAIKIMKKLLPLFILIFVFQGFGQLKDGSDGLIVYRDEKFPFSVFYPKDFAQVTPSHQQTRLKVVSDGGIGLSDFSVVVTTPPSPLSSSEFANGLKQRPDIINALIKQGLPEAKLLASGKTFLSNKEAFFIKSSGTFHNADESYDLIIYQTLLAFDGNSYTLTCRSLRDDFEDFFPICKLMASTFVLRAKDLALPIKKKAAAPTRKSKQ